MADLADNLHELSLIDVLKERYRCSRFRILIMGRANAGKTTLLRRVCKVQDGTKPVVYDGTGQEIKNYEPNTLPRWRPRSVIGEGSVQRQTWAGAARSLVPTPFRGEHVIENQITYPGCNFIFHDSCGIESGGTHELKVVRNFLWARANKKDLKDQLHAIWYCIPMDECRPMPPAEREFFNQGTGRVPLVLVFTKFDALVIQEMSRLEGQGISDDTDADKAARESAQRRFQEHYLGPIMNSRHPPKAYVVLEDMTKEDADCSNLIEKTADAINIGSLRQLFTATQMNSLHICIKDALTDLMDILDLKRRLRWESVALVVMPKFPHFWHAYTWQIWEGRPLDWIFLEFRNRRFLQDERFNSDRLEKFVANLLALFNIHFRRDNEVDFEDPKCCRVLIALLIVVKNAWWIDGDFWNKIDTSLKQFKTQDYMQKLEHRVTSSPLTGREGLIEFLYNHVAED